MNKGMKSEVGKPVFFVILAIAVIIICWFGWNSMKNPYERRDERAIVDAAQKRAASHGIDIRTVPTWSAMYYRNHPEDKRPHPPVKMPWVPAMGGTPEAPGAPPGVAAVPGTSPTPGTPAAPQ